jgi:hypothetical protein
MAIKMSKMPSRLTVHKRVTSGITSNLPKLSSRGGSGVKKSDESRVELVRHDGSSGSDKAMPCLKRGILILFGTERVLN